MSGHTPGPWKMRRALRSSDGGFDYGIGAVMNGRETCIAEAFEIVGAGVAVNAEANARLIAAAPETAAERDGLKAITAELLAALNIYAKPATYGYDGGKHAVAAIAKAKETK